MESKMVNKPRVSTGSDNLVYKLDLNFNTVFPPVSCKRLFLLQNHSVSKQVFMGIQTLSNIV